MMAEPLLSSPLGDRRLRGGPLRPARLDLFDQPSSPRIEQHDDLPAEFGDQSFGSSMSLGSSFDIGQRAGPSTSAAVAAATIAVTAAAASSALHASSSSPRPTASPQSSPTRLRIRAEPLRKSPPHPHDGLGAAMGTTLNSRTPGLAYKLSSPQPMDISPAPARPMGADEIPFSATPSKPARRTSRQKDDGLVASSSSERLPPGSAMKEDTPEPAPRLSTSSRHDDSGAVISDRKSSTASLGRLFGTELSLNSRSNSPECVFGATSKPLEPVGDDSVSSLGSPDKEPPAKRRPASMPLSQNLFAPRPSQRLSSSGMSSSNAGQSLRPNLLKSMTDSSAVDEAARERKSGFEALRQMHRNSDPTLRFGRPSRSRNGSSERLPEMASRDRTPKSSLPTPSHPTIIESPSPSKLADDHFAQYFMDPKSPEMLRAAGNPGQSSRAQQSLAGAAATSSKSAAPPRPRLLEKAASSAIVPGMLGSSLGKRSNPYAKRPPLSQQNSGISVKSALAAPGMSERLKPPMPRRCHSALDNSAAFSIGEDMSMGSADGGNTSLEESPSMRKPVGEDKSRFPPGFDANGSPIAGSSRPKAGRPSLLRLPSKDDSSPLGYDKRFVDNAELGNELVEASPRLRRPSAESVHLPGFGASEREGKVLPCFSVKKDGLMRITAETMRDVLDGRFDDQINSFTVVDCRFGYEYEGGHIRGAVNLCTLDNVKQHFLQPSDMSSLPLRSQSGKADAAGQTKKQIVIFHCEFSLKRGPSSALHLRQADRSLANDWPNCHYPELYVLDGGYANFFKENAAVCDPPSYVAMDDPKHVDSCSRGMHGFRKQFSRHRSFTFGDAAGDAKRPSMSDGAFAAASRNKALPKMPPSFDGNLCSNQEGDSSFDTSGSPSTMQSNPVVNRRRVLQRHATAGVLQLPGSSGAPASHFLSERWTASGRTQSALQRQAPQPPSRLGATAPMSPPSPASSLGHRPILDSKGTTAGDLSFGSSVASPERAEADQGGATDHVGDISTSSSVDASGLCESPCAAAQSRSIAARPPWR